MLDHLARVGSAHLNVTPYLPFHLAAGARFYEKGGWLRPADYGDPLAEQRSCREAVALFDVHSMGKMTVRGPDRHLLVERISTNTPPTDVGDAVYTCLCDADGKLVDDAVLYRFEHEYLMICNTVSREPVLRYLQSSAVDLDVLLEDSTGTKAYLAIQGPKSWKTLRRWLGPHAEAMHDIPYFGAREIDRDGSVLVCRTGYTGELGFELILSPERALGVWMELLDLGSSFGIVPAGGTALQALRTEKGYRGFGADIDRDMTPVEAGLGWTVRLGHRSVIGSSCLAEEVRSGKPRVWVVRRVDGGTLPLGAPVIGSGETPCGIVSSSAYGVAIGKDVGIARLDQRGRPGGALAVRLPDGQVAPLEFSAKPFYDPARERLTVSLTDD